MVNGIITKLNIINTPFGSKKGASKVYYVTHLPTSPEHIKYRYRAELDSSMYIKQIVLEFVTQIDDEYVPFKEMFTFDSKNPSHYDTTILEHVSLFLDLIHTGNQDLVVE